MRRSGTTAAKNSAGSRPRRGRMWLRITTCAGTAAVMALGGYAPAPATAATVTVSPPLRYDHDGAANHYKVVAGVRVTSVGDNGYTISAYLVGNCSESQGPEQDMGLEYGGSGEPWKRVSAPCSKRQFGGTTGSNSVEIAGGGVLSADRRVHIRVGAWGGALAGSWGWGDRTIVTV